MSDYDPTEHTVAEVTDYLATADEDERQRVQEAEAVGKDRLGIVNWTPTADQVEPDEDGYTRVPVTDAYQPGPPAPEGDETKV